ncbi:MAG: peptidoglycan-binding protein [Clostridiales bacterium]|nr:peptidoglycan-binding protein [Clostridiales bacterium]
MAKLIADISKHNGTVTMATMAKKVDGLIIRAGYRSAGSGTLTTDPKWATNIKNAVKQSLPVGVYWWTTAKSTAEAKAEAEYLLNLISGYTLSFPVWLDLEYYDTKRTGRADNLSKANRTQYAVAFLEAIEAAGYDAGVYCNKDFWSDSLDNSQLQTYARWIARYGSSCGVDCDMWQYTSSAKGSTYGASSDNIDLSHCYTDFISGAKSQFATATTTTEEETHDMDTLRKGDKGQQVRALQMLLGGLTVDGIFGTNTETAVKAWQNNYGLDADGICGPKTWAAILGG